MKNITLLSIFNLAIKHILILILAAAIFSGATFAYCEYIATPRYSASGSVLVTNGAITTDTDNSIQNTDVAASINLSKTVTDTLSTTGIYKQLAAKLDNKYSYSYLRSIMSISRRDTNSLFIDIHFTASSPKEAVNFVNAYLELAPDYIKSALPGTASSVFPSDSASKIYPNTVSFTLSAGFLGAVAVFIVIFILNALDTVIRDEDDFKEKFDIPVIGSVPDFNTAKSGKTYKGYYYNSYERRGTKNAK